MKGKYLKGKTIEYDGSQLSPLWAYTNFDVQGDSIISWRGPCEVSEEHMVDMEDRRRNAAISSPDMLHFVIECFGIGIGEAVLAQRLFVNIVTDLLREVIFEDADVEREYDNIYATPPGRAERGKLSVSVATVSPVSGLIHCGLNITTEGTPVLTAGLLELGVDDVDRFAVEAARFFIDEMKNVRMDECKVRPVS